MFRPFNMILTRANFTPGDIAFCMKLPIRRVYLSSHTHACAVQDASRNVADLLPYLSHYSHRRHMGFGDTLVCCILKCTSFYIKLIARSDPAYWRLCQPHPPLHWTDHCRDQWRDVAYRWKYPKFSTAMHSKRFMDAAGELSNMEPLFISVAC